MENFLIDHGFSWTFSKIFPYLLMVLIGVVLFMTIRIFSNKIWLKYLSFLLFFMPFGIYFMIFPIYEGDFSNNFVLEKYNGKLDLLDRGQITIISIPNCPFCYESIHLMKRIESRVGKNVKVNFIVCSDRVEDLDLYREIAGQNIDIILGKGDLKNLMGLARNKFPSFVYINDSKHVRLWSNDAFGALARDWFEKTIKSERN